LRHKHSKGKGEKMEKLKYGLDIQLFGDEATPLTFDEILEDKEYQAEFDRRVTKALETQRNKLLDDKKGKEEDDLELLGKYESLEKKYNELKASSLNDISKAKEESLINKLIYTSGTNDVEVLSLLINNEVSKIERNEDTDIEKEVSTLLETYKESKPLLFGVETKATGAGHTKTAPKGKTLKEEMFKNMGIKGEKANG
jgi:hypothetical protein